jgi:hypothetical protein
MIFPASSGCTTLERPLGWILPGATAWMSIQPKYDQASANKNNPQIKISSDFATREGGVTRISSARPAGTPDLRA